MSVTKITIEARIIKIHQEYINPDGLMIRTIDVTSSGKSRVQNYRLTEVGKKPRALVEDNWYEFKVFLNGMRRSGRHENDLLIADAYYMNDQSL